MLGCMSACHRHSGITKYQLNACYSIMQYRPEHACAVETALLAFEFISDAADLWLFLCCTDCDCTPLDLQLCIPAGYQLPITSSLHTSTPFNTSQQNTTLPLNSTSDYNGTLLPNPANSTYCHGDAWPQYTCTLLTNVSGASPEFWPNTTGVNHYQLAWAHACCKITAPLLQHL